MTRTPVVTLDAGVLARLEAYATQFAREFGVVTRTRWAGVYLQGLLLDGERKSIEPLSRRVRTPGWRGETEQALQQFVNQSPWGHEAVLRAYRGVLAEAFADPAGVLVLDDTGFPKQGTHSVGVARQYSGTLGKRANCQGAVSLHYAAPRGASPLALRLYLPEGWTTAPARLDAAGVPADERPFRETWRLALALLGQVRAEGLPHQAVLADAGYGGIGAFRRALEDRGETYLVGLSGEEVVSLTPLRWQPKPARGRGRPPSRWYRAHDSPLPLAVHTLAETLARTSVTGREGAKGPLQADFAWVRVWLGHGHQVGRAAADPPELTPRWLLVEWRADGTIKYALSNVPEATTVEAAVALWEQRWHVEQGYQQLKGELGLDHFEGRSWQGFHHHAALTFLAYGFLVLERQREATPPKDEPEDPAALPPFRRAGSRRPRGRPRA